MNSFLLKTIVIAVLGLTAISANATTYTVNENFTGSYGISDLGGGHFSMVHNEIFSSLTSGDSSLFSSSFTSTISNADSSDSTGLTWCNAGCSYTETLRTGDTLTGLFSLTNLAPSNGGVSYSGLLNITGGTGLFAGATGSGTFSAFDKDGLTTDHNLSFTVTSVPEPETYAMMLAGLGLMSFVARRRKEN